MENLNNKYNFKNSIRHFFNIDNLCFDDLTELKFESLSWTKPVPFKIYKTDNTERTIKFPNLLNFYHTLKTFEKESLFYEIKKMSDKKRVRPDLSTGEFSVLSYDESIQSDYFNLLKYDQLLILDIKNFYGGIYLHDFNFSFDDKKEQCIGAFNSGRTNGLLLGNYLSLYLAELYLRKIEDELDNEINTKAIDCKYEYFSDDFYFFCYDKDIDKIKQIFIKVLDNHDLYMNSQKIEVLDFNNYSKNNNLDKIWKKIIKDSEEKISHSIQSATKKYLPFFTQLNYRLSQIKESKYKRVFLVNFFKTQFFYELDTTKYILSESDFNYICYIYKFMPECIIYSINKIKSMINFQDDKFAEFLEARFKSTLNGNRYEEQLYYYYAIKICQKETMLLKYKKEILESQNQILISYCIMDGTILEDDYIPDEAEDKWLQNYHFLLKYNKDNIDILIPKYAKKENQRNSYKLFYKNNIDKKIPIICPIDKVQERVDNYLRKRIASYPRSQNTI